MDVAGARGESIDFRLSLGPRCDELAGAGAPAPDASADAPGDGDRAELRTFRAAAGREPGDPDYDYILAHSLLRAGHPAQALEHCRAAVLLDRTQPDYHLALGCALWRLGRADEAEAAFAAACGLRADAEALTARGTALLRLGRLSEATLAFEAAIDCDDRLAEAQGGLGVALWHQGRTAESFQRLRRAARLRPDSAEALANLGLALLECERVDEACAVLRRAAGLARDSARAQLELAEAAFAAGRLELAAEALALASQLDPMAITARPRSLAARDGVQLERLGAERQQARAGGARERAGTLIFDGAGALRALVCARGRLGRWLVIAAVLVALAAISRVVPPYVDHFLLSDDLVAVARAPVASDAEVRDRLAHQVAARRMRHLLDPDRCEVSSRPPWRRITCDYQVPVSLLPGVDRTLAFRIEVEQPYVLPRE